MKLVGITGGIGSGKTTVARFFQELGAPLYIADDEAKRLMHSSPIKEELIDFFGEEAYDESDQLNRPFIAKKVFNNQEMLDKLNGIVHPRVAEDFDQWVKDQEAPYILYEAAILFETGKYKDFDFVILVTAPEEERIKRVMERDKTTEKEVKSRMDKQWDDETKAKYANFIIKNIKLNETKNEVHKLHDFLIKV